MTQKWRENPYVSDKRYEFNIGDKVRLKPDIIGITSIDRGRVYTIEQFFDKFPCPVFRHRYDDKYCLSLKEMKNHWYEPHHWILVEPAKPLLDEELFTL